MFLDSFPCSFRSTHTILRASTIIASTISQHTWKAYKRHNWVRQSLIVLSMCATCTFTWIQSFSSCMYTFIWDHIFTMFVLSIWWVWEINTEEKRGWKLLIDRPYTSIYLYKNEYNEPIHTPPIGHVTLIFTSYSK